MTRITLSDAEALDAADPLRRFRDRFALPADTIYLDGNSLGARPVAAAERIDAVVRREWGEDLIGSWNSHDWIGAPLRIGNKIARLIGVANGEVVVADSTSVNLFKLLLAAARNAAPDLPIVAERANFPTDLHVARAVASLLGRPLREAAPDELGAALDRGAAAAVISHVHYRSGGRHDMPGLAARGRASGTPIVWDLSHSVGAIPIDLDRDGVELAVGCGYKYLNGGPGAPAFLYVASARQTALVSPIAGWLGHARPFDFGDAWEPAPGIERFLAGTPPILSLLGLEVGVDLMAEADQKAIAAKSAALFDLFRDIVGQGCPALALITPVDPAKRGSHISFAHPHAWPIVQALIARRIIGDFRAPDVARFGLTPLTLGHADVWRAAHALVDTVAAKPWRDPRFATRARVT